MPTSAEPPPLRCHLLIGPPASGKTTLAAVLAELVEGRVLSTDAIRAELYGDAAIQGPWPEVETLFHQRIREAVAEGVPVILDATHGQRPWRLAITQALSLPLPVQWIGWWLTTPLEQCPAWDRTRERQAGAAVIEHIHSYLPSATYVPDPIFLRKLNENPSQRAERLTKQARVFLDKKCGFFREEGFAYIAALNAAAIPDLKAHCRGVLGGLDRNIQAAFNRRQSLVPHRYSRLLDLERLLFLIRLLLEFPGVEFYSHTNNHSEELSEEVAQLRKSFRFQRDAPLPQPDQATFAVRAAFALAHRHGPCYGIANAIEQDLDWLWQQGFTSAFTVDCEIKPGSASDLVLAALNAGAGFPQAADRRIFQRQLGLLRYLIQNPFDAPDEHNVLDPDVRLDGRKLSRSSSHNTPAEAATSKSRRMKSQRQSTSLRLHLLERLQQIEGVDYHSQRKRYGSSKATGAPEVSGTTDVAQEMQKQELSTLDKDIELLITGYGFRNLISSVPTNP
jgi:predicted kinase